MISSLRSARARPRASSTARPARTHGKKATTASFQASQWFELGADGVEGEEGEAVARALAGGERAEGRPRPDHQTPDAE